MDRKFVLDKFEMLIYGKYTEYTCKINDDNHKYLYIYILFHDDSREKSHSTPFKNISKEWNRFNLWPYTWPYTCLVLKTYIETGRP